MIKDIKLYIATWSRQDTDNLLLLGIKCQGSVCWNIAAYTSDRRTPLLHESYQVRRLTVSNKGSQRVGMKLMRGDKIHSSLQFQGWRSWDLRKVQRLIREERSLMRDIIEGGSSNISVCVCVLGRTQSMRWLCPAGVNLFMELRFPHDMSLSSPSYAKTHCVLFLNNSQEHYGYGQ